MNVTILHEIAASSEPAVPVVLVAEREDDPEGARAWLDQQAEAAGRTWARDH